MSHSEPTETNLNRTNAASAGHANGGDHKRLRTMHVLNNTIENASSVVDALIAKSPDLGLMPIVAELVNEFIDTQAQMVYIV